MLLGICGAAIQLDTVQRTSGFHPGCTVIKLQLRVNAANRGNLLYRLSHQLMQVIGIAIEIQVEWAMRLDQPLIADRYTNHCVHSIYTDH